MAKPSFALVLRSILTTFALKLPGAPRLSNFEMIEPPASAREMHDAIIQTLRDALTAAQSDPTGRGISSAADAINSLGNRFAVAEVDLTSGLWPLRRTRRVKIMRPSHVQYWCYEDGTFTPGSQAEELERRWAIANDFKRQSLSRSLERQLTSSDAIHPGEG